MFWRLRNGGRCSAISVLPTFLPLALLLIACEPPADRSAHQGDGSVVVSLDLPAEPRIGPSPLTLELTDREGDPIEGASVRVEGNMTHAGMVPVLVEARELGGGAYRADDFTFTMAGDWFVTATVETPAARSDQ